MSLKLEPVSDVIRSKIFNKAGFHIFKSFISKNKAISIRKEILHNKNCFFKLTDEGNHRLFTYPNSPYKYPFWLNKLYKSIMLRKLSCCINEKFYIDYCSDSKVDSRELEDVFEAYKLHTWSCFYWYKDGEKHQKHIDNYGEVAAFLILSELGNDYNSGGLYIYDDSEDRGKIYLDEFYELGDLVILDQARLWHEVKPILKSNNQIGRLQYYVPTIPYGYMKDILLFEDYEEEHFFSKRMNIHEKANGIESLRKEDYENIHYSRKNYFRHWSNLSMI